MNKLQILERFIKTDIDDRQAMFKLQNCMKTEYAIALAEKSIGEGTASIIRHAVAFIKKQEKSSQPRFAFAFEQTDGSQVFTNAHFIIRLAKPLNDIIGIPKSRDSRLLGQQQKILATVDNLIDPTFSSPARIYRNVVRYYKAQGYTHIRVRESVFSIKEVENPKTFSTKGFDLYAPDEGGRSPGGVVDNSFTGLLCPWTPGSVTNGLVEYDADVLVKSRELDDDLI